jgi:hypothetical protein
MPASDFELLMQLIGSSIKKQDADMRENIALHCMHSQIHHPQNGIECGTRHVPLHCYVQSGQNNMLQDYMRLTKTQYIVTEHILTHYRKANICITK